MTLGGCFMALQNCNIFNDGDDEGSCVLSRIQEITRLTEYFGSTSTPVWPLGMGWVFGSRIVNFIGSNAEHFKVRGAADVSLGFWLAPLEDVSFVNMQGGLFHDHPEVISSFAADCSGETVLVHRMNSERWRRGFDERRCELSCGSVG